jgi:GNAT superfamily N-acetyltransferase
MVDPEIRRATAEDAAFLAAVYRSAYRENREQGFPAKAEDATADEVGTWIADHRVYVVTVDREVVGGVRLEETDPGRVKLSRLADHEDWKGDGIGGALLDHAEAGARQAGHEVVWLTTPPEHPVLPDLYRARGYAVTGEYPLEYRDYDEVVMEKRLG